MAKVDTIITTCTVPPRITALLEKASIELTDNIALKAARNPALIVRKIARSKAPVDTGTLRSAIRIKSKVASTKDGLVYAIAGIDNKVKKVVDVVGPDGVKRKRTLRPYKYAHLVEFGHKWPDGNVYKGTQFMQEAVNSLKNNGEQLVVDELKKGIEKYFKK